MVMTKKQILKLLRELGRELLRQDVEGEIGIVGGAAMVLAFDARIATKDVDAIFKPSETIRRAAHKIAERNNIPADWLNDGIKGFLPGDPSRKTFILDAPGLRVWVPEPEYMLAMKAISARVDTYDGEDLRLLIRHLHLRSSEDVLKIVEKYYPAHAVPTKVTFFIEELLEATSLRSRTPSSAPGPEGAVGHIHSWRLCPQGQHWVRAHHEKIPPSKEHPDGSVIMRRAHCARNPSGKDQLYPDEILEMSRRHFPEAKNKPCPLSLGFKNGNKYDDLIAGWVQYWNEVLQPAELLEPNFVKALIATESSFNPEILAEKRNKNSARGLMQVRNDTREILGDGKGEIKDHYVNATREELSNPSINICAGVRWLFHKRDLLSKRLKRPATWLETAHRYKGTSKTTKGRADAIVKKLQKQYEELQKCGN